MDFKTPDPDRAWLLSFLTYHKMPFLKGIISRRAPLFAPEVKILAAASGAGFLPEVPSE
jgi:hypothetical protein